MIINSFNILDTDMNSIGTGVYLAASTMDHSCDPNAVATFDGKTLNVRAVKDMPSMDWTQHGLDTGNTRTTVDMNSIGTGVYLAASTMDHSCDPNAVATFDGKTLNVRAVKDMPSMDWTQVTQEPRST
ncbi:SET and MYND domain-containing protein 3 [Operophtera brumata]|uniref:SET and MYND domain-containing protein 3 n=1 Tax=Operophtera brumata TaxID=104452 RepID=A0A0L7L5D7_OPEBR|nr:SET and MYND domain-containing protein 3 [Operophtera brumata]